MVLGKDKGMRCNHQLHRSDAIIFECIEEGDHADHRSEEQVRWRNGQKGTWRIFATTSGQDTKPSSDDQILTVEDVEVDPDCGISPNYPLIGV